jgi:Glycosyl hydrolases family 15
MLERPGFVLLGPLFVLAHTLTSPSLVLAPVRPVPRHDRSSDPGGQGARHAYASADKPHPDRSGTHPFMTSAPVRVGNAAAGQLQLDIYGELIDAVYLYNKHGAPISHDGWQKVSQIIDWVCEHWDQPDEGVWEVRGGRRQFTYSRLMCWVAVERAVRVARQRGLPADLVRWMAVRDTLTILSLTRKRGRHDRAHARWRKMLMASVA